MERVRGTKPSQVSEDSGFNPKSNAKSPEGRFFQSGEILLYIFKRPF